MIKRPYQNMSFSGPAGTRSKGGFGRGKPWERGDRGDRPSRGGFDRGSRGGSFDREMHPATCNKCGQSCEVPFFPNGSKPIYCRDCFKRDDAAPKRFGNDRHEGGSFRERSFEDRRPTGNNDDVNRQLKEINAKLDAILEQLSSQE